MRHELALLRTDYEALTESLTELTYAAFQEIQEHPELFEKRGDVSSQENHPQENGCGEIVKEVNQLDENNSSQENYDNRQDTENDPLLAAVKAFEEQQALTEEWTTPDEYFGSIRSVQPKSLADSYGIVDCDRIIQFGSITVSTFRDLKQFGEYYEQSRGRDIDVSCYRNF